MPPPDSKQDPLLGFGGYSSPNFYSNHQYYNEGSQKLRDMSPGDQLSADSPDDKMNIDMAMNIAQLESDEYATTAAEWWRRVNTLFTENAKAIRAKADAMTKYWDSGAAEKFFMTIGGSLWSLDEWAKAASDNAAQLDALAGAISTYQTKAREIWNGYWEDVREKSVDEMSTAEIMVEGQIAANDPTGQTKEMGKDMRRKRAMDDIRPHLRDLENAFSSANSKMNLGPAIYMGPENALAVDEKALSAALNQMMQQIAANIAANMPKPPMPPTPGAPPGAPNIPKPPVPPTPPAPPAVPPNPNQRLADAPAPAPPPTPPAPPAPPAPPTAPNLPTVPPVVPPVQPPANPAAARTPTRPPMPPSLSGRSAPAPPGTPPSPGRSPLSGRNSSPFPPMPGKGGTPSKGLGGRQAPGAPPPMRPTTRTPGGGRPGRPEGMPPPPSSGPRTGSGPNRPTQPQLGGRNSSKPISRPAPPSFGEQPMLPPPGKPGTTQPASPQLRGRKSDADRSAQRGVPTGQPSAPGTKPNAPKVAATRPAKPMRNTPITNALAPDTAESVDLGGRPRQSVVQPDTPEMQRAAMRPGLAGQLSAALDPNGAAETPAGKPGAGKTGAGKPGRKPAYETNATEQEKPWTVADEPVSVLATPEPVEPEPDRAALGARGTPTTERGDQR